MLVHPRIGTDVVVWYRAGMREHMPFHARMGKVVIRGKGKPRNHGVEIDGQMIVVPCGNLYAADNLPRSIRAKE